MDFVTVSLNLNENVTKETERCLQVKIKNPEYYLFSYSGLHSKILAKLL